MFKASLRLKILLLFLLVALIPLFIASTLQLNYYSGVTRQSVQQEEQKTAKDCSDQMETWIQKKASQVNNIIKAHPELKQLDKKHAADLLRNLFEIDSDLEVPAAVDKDGMGLTTEGNELNLSERDYFKDAKAKKTLVISNTLTSKVTGNKIIMFAAPILDDSGSFQGALLSPITINSLEKIVGNIKSGKTGYGVLLSADGKFIFHPQKDILEKSYEEYSKNPGFIKAFKEGVMAKHVGMEIYTDDKGVQKIASYDRIDSTGWKLVVIAPYKEAYEHLNTVFFIFLATLLGALILVFFISLFASRYISKPVIEVSNVTKKAETGDFTERLQIKRTDEIGTLAGNINHLFGSLSSMVNSVKIKSDKLDNSSANLSATSEQIAACSEQVSIAVQESAKGIAEQSKDLEVVNTMLNKFNAELDSIHNLLVVVNESSELTEKLSNEGRGQMNALTASIEEIKKAFGTEIRNIQELNTNIQKIDEITSLIKSLSGQTNMLALNAAIEAARAGESGKGFAVVADEIRKLAEQSRHSSDGIAQIVKDIMGGTQEIVGTSVEVESRLTSQIDAVTHTTKSFEGILNSVMESIPRVKQAFNEINALVKEKDLIIERVQNLSAVSQETTATAEEVAASAQEMTAATQEISSMAQELQVIATDLNEKIKEFKISNS